MRQRRSCGATAPRCAALTDDGLPPLAAAGLKLHDRLSRIATSLDHVASLAGGLPGGLSRLRQLLRRGLEETAALWPAVREAYKWVQRVARILKNEEGLPTKTVRRRLVQLLGRMRRATTGEPSVRAGLKQFLKVTRSYWPGLFRCYDAADLPRTNNDLEHTLRQPSLPRASVQRSAAVLAGSGRDGPGAGDLGLGDAAPAGGRLGVASGLCGALARAASGVGGTARGAAEAAALPP